MGLVLPMGGTKTSGGSSGGMHIGTIQAGQSFPTTRPDGSPLQLGDYVKPIGTLPFTVGSITFTSYRDTASWNTVEWLLNANPYQKTNETPVNDKTTESLSGTANYQSNINIENKAAIEARIIHLDTLPTPEAAMVGKPAVQYIGATTTTAPIYIHNHFYEVVADGAAYKWQEAKLGAGETQDVAVTDKDTESLSKTSETQKAINVENVAAIKARLEQVATLPTATVAMIGTAPVQYIGADDETSTPKLHHGRDYEVISDGAGGAKWVELSGGGTVTDVKVDSTSVLDSGEADIKTTGSYDKTTNPFALKDYADQMVRQYDTMPTASADYLGKVVQYIGVDDTSYKHGYFYECEEVTPATTPATYKWSNKRVQADGRAIQVTTMPVAQAGELNNVYQYIGETDTDYTNGYFYKCIEDATLVGVYLWENIPVQPGASAATINGVDVSGALDTESLHITWKGTRAQYDALTDAEKLHRICIITDESPTPGGGGADPDGITIKKNTLGKLETVIGGGLETTSTTYELHPDGKVGTYVDPSSSGYPVPFESFGAPSNEWQVGDIAKVKLDINGDVYEQTKTVQTVTMLSTTFKAIALDNVISTGSTTYLAYSAFGTILYTDAGYGSGDVFTLLHSEFGRSTTTVKKVGGIYLPLDETTTELDADSKVAVKISAEAGNTIVKKGDGLYSAGGGSVDIDNQTIVKRTSDNKLQTKVGGYVTTDWVEKIMTEDQSTTWQSTTDGFAFLVDHNFQVGQKVTIKFAATVDGTTKDYTVAEVTVETITRASQTLPAVKLSDFTPRGVQAYLVSNPATPGIAYIWASSLNGSETINIYMAALYEQVEEVVKSDPRFIKLSTQSGNSLELKSDGLYGSGGSTAIDGLTIVKNSDDEIKTAVGGYIYKQSGELPIITGETLSWTDNMGFLFREDNIPSDGDKITYDLKGVIGGVTINCTGMEVAEMRSHPILGGSWPSIKINDFTVSGVEAFAYFGDNAKAFIYSSKLTSSDSIIANSITFEGEVEEVVKSDPRFIKLSSATGNNIQLKDDGLYVPPAPSLGAGTGITIDTDNKVNANVGGTYMSSQYDWYIVMESHSKPLSVEKVVWPDSVIITPESADARVGVQMYKNGRKYMRILFTVPASRILTVDYTGNPGLPELGVININLANPSESYCTKGTTDFDITATYGFHVESAGLTTPIKNPIDAGWIPCDNQSIVRNTTLGNIKIGEAYRPVRRFALAGTVDSDGMISLSYYGFNIIPISVQGVKKAGTAVAGTYQFIQDSVNSCYKLKLEGFASGNTYELTLVCMTI